MANTEMPLIRRRRILTICGTRPEAVKLAPVLLALRSEPQLESLLAVTAQHRQLLDQVLALFGIVPDFDLNLMQPGQSISDLTSRALLGLSDILGQVQPDIVLVQGDTTTVMAGALAAFYNKTPVGHVEAGLRSFDKFQPFPEEVNRRLTSVIADLHFAPTEGARRNLLAEGVSSKRIFVTGNTAIDALLSVAAQSSAIRSPEADMIDPRRRLVVVTTHRRENWGEPIRNVCRAIRRLVERFDDVEVLYSLHPNPLVKKVAHDELGSMEHVHLVDAIDYGPWVKIMQRADLILTDSGGIQEEAPSLHKPVLVLRNVTERPEGVDAGVLKVVGTDTDVVYAECEHLLRDPVAYARMTQGANPYGDGLAAQRIVRHIADYFSSQHSAV